MNQATSSTVATNITTNIKATDVIAMIAGLTIIIKTIDAMWLMQQQGHKEQQVLQQEG
jgi:hypothetical protein